MQTTRAVVRGLMRMMQCSGLVLVLWLVVVLAALPLAIVMEDTIRTDVGSSLMHADLREGLDLGWLEEFQHRRGGLAQTLLPVRLSPAMVWDTLELWLSGGWVSGNRALAAAAGLFLMVWILLQGGVLTQLSSPDLRFRWSTFLAAGGSYFFRFLRLAVILGVAYFGVYKLAYWLFPAIDKWTRDLTVETEVLAIHLLGAAVIAVLLAIVHLVADFARIATVREKRRSMILAVGRSAVQVASHPIQAMGVFVTMLLLLGAIQGIYFWLAPGIAGASPTAIVTAFLFGQLYLLTRWALRVARYGAEIELFDTWTGPHPARGQSTNP